VNAVGFVTFGDESVVEIVVEQSQQRPDRNPRNAVVAAGDVLEEIADLLQQDRSRKCQHEQRQPAVAQQYQARQETSSRRNRSRGEQAADRLAVTCPRRQQPYRVGAEAKKRRLPERHDPGVAEDQIE